jgi:hypothetical protein
MRAFHHAIGPAQFDHELSAVLEVGKPDDRALKGCGWVFHELSMRQSLRYVKYIIAGKLDIISVIGSQPYCRRWRLGSNPRSRLLVVQPGFKPYSDSRCLRTKRLTCPWGLPHSRVGHLRLWRWQRPIVGPSLSAV